MILRLMTIPSSNMSWRRALRRAASFEGLVDGVDAELRVEECSRENFQRIGGRLLVPEVLRQRLQALFAGHGRLGAALGLVGGIEVFELALVQRGFDPGLELIRQLALLGNGSEDGRAAILKLAEVGQLFLDIANLDLIEIAGGLFAVAGNERYSSAIIQQFDDSHQSADRQIQGLGNVDEDFRGKRFRI